MKKLIQQNFQVGYRAVWEFPNSKNYEEIKKTNKLQIFNLSIVMDPLSPSLLGKGGVNKC